MATVNWATDQVMRKLVPVQTRAEWVDATGAVQIVERALPVGWLGRRLADLDEPGRWRLAMLNRAGVASVPANDLVGQEGDVLTLSVAASAMRDLEARLAETGKGH